MTVTDTRTPQPAANTPTASPAPAPAAARWSRRLRSLGLNLAILAALLLAVHLWQTRHVPKGAAPDFTAPAIASQPNARMSLAQWRAAHPGRAVALHFWAEWCGICRLEQHSISRLGADWPVLTVAMRSGNAAAVHRVQAQRGLGWATVVDEDAAIAKSYGLPAVPALVVIAPDGRISATSIGYTSEIGMRLRMWWASL